MDIIIPIYTVDTPFEEVNKCLEHIIRNTKEANIILSCSDKKQPINVNKGISRAKGKYVVILDWDVYVPEGWLDKLLEVMNRDPKTGIVGAKMGGKYGELAPNQVIGEVSNIAGGCMLIRNIGLKWDEKYPSGVWADTDFCKQYIEKGYKIIRTDEVEVEHDHLDLTKYEGRANFYDEGQKIYRKKWRKPFNPQDVSVCVLSWNELETLKKSIPVMLEDKLDVWVADNGSTDGTQAWLKEQNVKTVLFDNNMGISYARNRVIEQFKGKYLLMIDGDIKYIKGSAEGLWEELECLPDNAYCLGIHNKVWAGTDDESKATPKWDGSGEIKNVTAIAWTQYGLFRGDIIRRYKFPEYGVWYGRGYGFEDDFIHAKLEEDGYESYFCNKPFYYHDKHRTAQQFSKEEYEKSMNDRKEELLKRFPGFVHWSEREGME